jgi:hypothetical protein
MFKFRPSELDAIDQTLASKLAWAKEGNAIGDQLALDASRILSCVAERLDDYRDQGFFKRCWSTLSGKTGALERANQNDLIEMQKHAWRYIDLLQERDLLTAHSIITVKNNLLTLSLDHQEVKEQVTRLADRVYNRFVVLEDRVEHLEISQNIHGWLLTIKTNDYDEKYPKYLRMLRVVSDFFSIKRDSWNFNELKYMHQGLTDVGLDVKEKVSTAEFINCIIDEIESSGYQSFSRLVSLGLMDNISNDFIVDSVSAPAFSSLYQIKGDYSSSSRVIKALQKKEENKSAIHKFIRRLFKIKPQSHGESIKSVMSDFITERGVDLSVQVPLKDLATEILACFGLVSRLVDFENDVSPSVKYDMSSTEIRCDTPIIANEGALPEKDLITDSNILDILVDFGNDVSPSVKYDMSSTEIRCDTPIIANEGTLPEKDAITDSDILAIEALAKNFREKASWGFDCHFYGEFDMCLWSETKINDLQDYALKIFPIVFNAANKGNVDAEFCLGVMRLTGCGIDSDASVAFKWLEKAANHGDFCAMSVLGRMFFRGLGVEREQSQGWKWLAKAAKCGDKASALYLYKSMPEALCKVKGIDFYIDGDLLKNIPFKKYSSARESFVKDNDDVFALLDTTVFGSCSDGVAFGLRGVYWKNSFLSPKFLSWDDLSAHENLIVSDGSSSVKLWTGDNIDLSGSDSNAAKFIIILKYAIAIHNSIQAGEDIKLKL